MQTLRQKIARNITFSSAARIIDTFLALVITALLARYLGRAGFGDYIIVFTFWYIFTVLADLGLYSITVREISRDEKRESEIISNAFTLRMASSALIFFIGMLALFFFPYGREVKMGVAVAALGFWALFSGQVLMGVFQKNIRIDRPALAEMAGRIVQLALVVIFIKGDLRFLSIIIAFSVSGIVNLLVNFWFARKFVNIRIAANFALWKKMLSEGYPLALSAILVMLYFRLNVIILSLLKGQEAVGVFGVGYKILENIIFFPAMFVGLLMPIMSRAAKNDIAKFKEIIQKAFSALLALLAPMVFLTLVLSDKIVYAIGGKNFPESASVLNILIFAAAVIFLGTLWSNAIIALGKQGQLAKIYFGGAALNLAANLVLIPSLSYKGAAWSTLATEFLVTALMAAYLRLKIGYLPRAPRLLKIILAALAASAGIFALDKVFTGRSPFAALAVLLPVGVFIYFAVLYALGGIKREEFGLFFKKDLPR